MPTDQELDAFFGDVEDMNEDNIGQAAQQIASQMAVGGQPSSQEVIPQGPQSIQHVQTIAPPPSAPMETEEDREMKKYNEEKQKLFQVKDQLVRLAHEDQSGIIIRNFDLSQIVLKVGDEIDRINGLIVFRSLKARCKSIKMSKDGSGEKAGSEVLEQEQVAGCLYEVWGVMEDGGVGLTSSYSPEMVLCVISLRSGYDLPPA